MKKKILIIISLIMALIILSACGGESYKFKALPGGPGINDKIEGGNSGVCVQKGGYIYMINGIVPNNFDNNKFNAPVKGAIYRLKLDDKGNIIEDTRIMAPKIFYSPNAGDGLYIPDNSDKLYYISPSMEKDKYGNFMYYYSDIFMVNLDGTKTKKIGTIDSFTKSKFVTIESKVYFVYETEGYKDENDRYVEGAEKVYKIFALGEDGKKYEIASNYTKALIGDEYIYYTTVKELEGEITGVESFNTVYRKAIKGGAEKEEVIANGKNISEGKYNIDLIEYKEDVLYYTKNISAGSSTLTLYYAYNFKGGQEYQLNSMSYNNPYFLGFDSSGNYKGTLFYFESSIILLKAKKPDEKTDIKPQMITSLNAEPQYLFMEGDVLYFMSSEKMYSIDISTGLSNKNELLDFKVTINMERYFPKKIGSFIYFIGNAEEEYYSKYLYRHDITIAKKDLPDDYKPERLGALSKADDDLRIEAEKEDE